MFVVQVQQVRAQLWETVEIPQLQLVEFFGQVVACLLCATTGAVGFRVPKTVEVPQLQHFGKVVDVPVVLVPQLQFIDKVLTVPVDNLLLWRLWRWEGFSPVYGHFSRSVHPDVERQASPR